MPGIGGGAFLVRGWFNYANAENMGIFNAALTVDLRFFCFSGSLIGYFRHLAT